LSVSAKEWKGDVRAPMDNNWHTGLLMTLKRLVDESVSVLGLAVLGPLLAVVAAFVKTDSRGSVFFADAEQALESLRMFQQGPQLYTDVLAAALLAARRPLGRGICVKQYEQLLFTQGV
jgi:hypothetical protein